MPGRRKRLGQIGDVADRDGPFAEECADADRRQRQAGRRGVADRERPPFAATPRHAHGDDLPGADDGAQPSDSGGPPDRRGVARAYVPRWARPKEAHPRDDGAGAPARGRAHLRVLPSPPLRRPAPAHHDRDGAGARTEAFDRGRADHRARRHHAEADPDLDPRPAARSRHRGAVHHPRHGRGRRDRRPRRRDAERQAGRDRRARHDPAHAHDGIHAQSALFRAEPCAARAACRRARSRSYWKPTSSAKPIASVRCSAKRARSPPPTMSRSPCARAARSASSAKAARANPRWRAASCG